MGGAEVGKEERIIKENKREKGCGREEEFVER